MGQKYNNQIKAGSGFTIPGEYPIDDRTVVESSDDLATVPNKFEGIEVYAVADKKSYKLINGAWYAVATELYVDQKLGGDVTVSEMTGATAEQDGTGGVVPAPKTGDEVKYLRGDATWSNVEAKHVDVNGEALINFIPIILTQAEYDTLINGGTITLNGQEISYEENRIYMIKRFVEASVEEEPAEEG